MTNSTRLAVIVISAVLLSALVSAFGLQRLLGSIREEWSTTAAQIQVDGDYDRTLSPIVQEIQLVAKMQSDPAFERWLANPEDAAANRAALDYMNKYRKKFQDQSYFFAMRATGGYYHNNAEDEFNGRELRYTLSPDNADDAWFYSGLKIDRDLTLNVDYDRGLGVIKLWINQRIYDQKSQVAGIVGTGFDLTTFLNRYVRSETNDFHTVFTDSRGAIQLSPSGRDIQFGMLGNPYGAQRVIFDEASSSEDRMRLEALFEQAKKQQGEVVSAQLAMSGGQQLVGVAYFPLLDWFEVTRIDAHEVLSFGSAVELYLLAGGAVLVALLVIIFAIVRAYALPQTRLSRLAHIPPPDATEFSTARASMPEELARVADRLSALIRSNQDFKENEEVLEAKLASANKALSVDRMHDESSGILTEVAFRFCVEAACGWVVRSSIPTSLVIIRPIEPFNAGGEQWRQHGTLILRQMARRLENLLDNPADVIGRLNEGDIGVLLPGLGPEAAAIEADRLLRELNALDLTLPYGSSSVALQVIVGVESVINPANAKPERLLRRAEQSVYIASQRVAGESTEQGEKSAGDGPLTNQDS